MTAQPLTLSRDDVLGCMLDITADYEAKGLTPVFGLYGPPGTGKTTLVHDFAKRLLAIMKKPEPTGIETTQMELNSGPVYGRRIYKFACTPSGLSEQLLGGPGPDEQGVWRPLLPAAALHAWGYYGEPGVLLLDDIHVGGRDLEAGQYTVYDSGVGGVLTLPNGQQFRPLPGYVVVWTSNGTLEDLDPAIRDRSALRFPVMKPSTQMLDSLDPEIRDLCELDYDGAAMNQVATFREWQTMSRIRKTVGLARATLIALGDIDRAKKMLEVMAANNIQEATTATVAIINSMRSGA